MAISLSSLKRAAVDEKPLLLIYGTAGMGKTSTALEAPNAVYLRIAPERPPAGVEAVSFGELTEWSQVMEAMKALYVEQHDFQSVVVDSLDALEALVWRETCARGGWKSIEEPGYGKGYQAADAVWADFITGCNALRRAKNMNIIWLALAHAENHEEPGKQPYKRYSMRLHKRGESLTTQAADAVIFINTVVTVKEQDTGFNRKSAFADGGGSRFAFTDGRPAFVAKNRFRMEPKILLPPGKAWDALAKFLPGASSSAEEPAAADAA